MTHIDRRLLLQTGMFGLGAFSIPGFASAAASTPRLAGFTHNVASGEPSQNSVLLWTRYVGGESRSRLTAEIAETLTFNKIISSGEVEASPLRDHCAKIVLDGLQPNRWYYYRFIAADGSASPVGRTRTLPEGDIGQFRLGVFSCSNMPFGYFTAYAHAAMKGNIDLAVHLGDYLYEYQRGVYPNKKVALPDRIINPEGETVSLADYRLRYASYRADADLQRLHQVVPMISMWDDHEFTNDAWSGGAQNHQPETEGDWSIRKAAAEQVYREWMPVHDIPAGGKRWTRYDIGSLASIHLTESRIGARSQQLDLGEIARSEAVDPVKVLTNFRDGPWQAKERTVLGLEQEKWLEQGFKESKARWNIWAQQTLVGSILQPGDAQDWLAPNSPDFIKSRVAFGALAAKAKIPTNMDAWDGYPAARARALKAAQEAAADLVVLTGDTHNAWAFDLPHDGQSAGVELGGHSVSSPGFESYLTGAKPADIAKSVVGANEQLKWADTSQRGYMTVTLTPSQVTSNWHFMDDIRKRDISLSGSHRMIVRHGRRKFDPL